MTWSPDRGDWSAVLMNADGSRGVAADVSVGAEADFLIWLAIGLLIAGGICLLGGAGLIYVGCTRVGSRRPRPSLLLLRRAKWLRSPASIRLR